MAGTNLPRVPEGLRDLMKAYTKEVLREKPVNLYEFSSSYFERIAADRMPQKVRKYEPPQSYEIIMKNRIKQQVPISLVFNIIPDNLTDLIKKFIKAVLREKPDNLLAFAVEYFQRLRHAHSPRMEYTKYSAYEKYVDEKGNSTSITQEKCTCGRILNTKTSELSTETKEQTTVTYSVQYLRAVCIIQKYIRKYLKEKREKSVKKSLKTESKDNCRSEDYMNAIFVIQRHFRRYLAKKRAEKPIDSQQNRYDSVEYMNAIRIIQRYCRRYLRKRATKARPLNSHKTPATDTSLLSLTTAAFIIQRAFRNMVKTRRAKRHINAELDQGDEVNDNASEAASYTSASTALLSTESTCEHAEFGGVNYEEGVHQQTIQEDEEVENDNTNNLQNEYKMEAIKSKGKSINSDGNELTLDEINDEMNKRKEKRFYAQKTRRDINKDPSIEKGMTSRGNSEDFPSEVVTKSYNPTENIIKNIMRADSLASEAEQAKEARKKSSAQRESLDVDPEADKTESTERLESEKVEKGKNSEKTTADLVDQDDKLNEGHTEKSAEASISPVDSLNTIVQSNARTDSADSTISNQEKSPEKIMKSSSQVGSVEEAASPDHNADVVSSTQPINVSNIEEPVKKSSSQATSLDAAASPIHSMDSVSSTLPTDESIKKCSSQDATAPSLDSAESKLSTLPRQVKDTEEANEETISKIQSLEIAAQPDQESKQKVKSAESHEKSTSNAEDTEKSPPSDEVTVSTENILAKNDSNNSIKKSESQAESIEAINSSEKPESFEHSASSTTVDEQKNAEESIQRSDSQAKSLETVTQSDELATKTTIEKPIEKSFSKAESLEAAAQPDKQESAPQSQKALIEKLADIGETNLGKEATAAPIAPADEQQPASGTKAKLNKSLQSSDKEESSAIELVDEDSVTVGQEKPNESIDKKSSTDEAAQKSSSTESPDNDGATDTLLVSNAPNSDSPHSENDYSIEVNSLQSVLNTMKEKYNQDESILSGKKSPSLSPTEEQSTELLTAADSNLESATPAKDNKDSEILTAEEDSKSNSIITAADSLKENEDDQPYIPNTKDNYQSEETLEEIGKSIIIHSVLPGEDDYVLPLSRDTTLSSDATNNESENVADNDKNIEDKMSIAKPSEHRQQLNLKAKESQESLIKDSAGNQSRNKDEEINETIKKKDAHVVDSPTLQSVSISKDDSNEVSKEEKKMLNQETEGVELDSTESNSEVKIQSKPSTESIEKLDDQVDKTTTKLNEAPSLETSDQDAELGDRVKRSAETSKENLKIESPDSSTDKSENVENAETSNSKTGTPKGSTSLAELTESADAEISENKSVDAKEDNSPVSETGSSTDIPKIDSKDSVEERKIIQQSQSIPKISVELSTDENEATDSAIDESTTDVKNKDIDTPADLTQQESIKESVGDKDEIKATSDEETSSKQVDEEVEEVTNKKLSEESSKGINDNEEILSGEDEKTSSTSSSDVKPTIKSTLSEEAEEKMKEIIQLTLLEEAERKTKDSTEINASQEAKESATQDTKLSSTEESGTTVEDHSKIVLTDATSKKSERDDKDLEHNKAKSIEDVQEKIDDNIGKTLAKVAEKSSSTSDAAIEDDLDTKEASQKCYEPTKSNTIGSVESNSQKDVETRISTEDEKPKLAANESQLSTEDSSLQAQQAAEDSQVSVKDKAALSKDSIDAEDEPKKKTLEKNQSAVETTDEKDQPIKKNEAKSESLNVENKSSLHLSHQSIDTQNKKLPIAKDKQQHSTSFSSGRLTNAPVAELQLKSFKTAPDAGNWYDVHNEPFEDTSVSDNSAKDIQRSDEMYPDNVRLLGSQSMEVAERRPNYIFGEPPTSPEAIKPKQSVAFFISFDGDDGKATFKIPKKFLNREEPSSEKSEKHLKKDDEEELSMEPVLSSEDDYIESDSDIGYQQYGMQKLQTIHELNENESSNELRSLLDKPNDNEVTILEPEVKTNVEDEEEVNEELVKQVQEKVENSLKVNELEEVESKSNETIVDENKPDKSHEHKLKTSAQIIQRAFKNYLARRENSTKQSSVADKEKKNLPNAEVTKLNENEAATRIQKAIRQFLARIALKTTETTTSKDRKYTTAEILAAIRIQKMFRNYIQRKKLAYNDDISKGTSATSLITIIPNTNDSHTPEISINDGELSDDMNVSTSEVITSKPEWFVGSQRISLEPSERSVNVVESSETGTIGITEITDDDDAKLATDIGNIVNDLNASEVFAQDNGASNNSAGSTKDNDLVEDLAIAAFGALDANSTLAGATNRQILSDFLIKEIEYSSILEPYPSSPEEVVEEKCIKKIVSRGSLVDDEIKEEKADTQLDSLAADAIDEATLKLMKTDEVIEKMSQRRSSETQEKLKEDFSITEPIFGEPIIRSMSLLQEQSSLDIEDGDIIVYNRLQRDETRESSAQSESVVFGNDAEEDDKEFNTDAETARTQLSRHYTIAGDDPRAMFRSVTIDETVRYIEDDGRGIDNSMSFCLDDETSENIRKKMMAYSLSEGDSDYYDPNKVMPDDFHIDTAMTDAMDTSTETESTIVSAATKIQAGARGFLARRRLRRASAGTKSSTQDTKASFGNDAISESLERFIEEEAAKKIQVAYRLHSKKQKKQTNNVKSASLESSLAAKRQTLQRGDALRNDSNSTPEDENSSSTSVAQRPKDLEKKSSKESGTRSKRSTDLTLKWPAVRQNSMPVQIDCEVLRPIPKHMRRRIKSAENGKKKNRK